MYFWQMRMYSFCLYFQTFLPTILAIVKLLFPCFSSTLNTVNILLRRIWLGQGEGYAQEGSLSLLGTRCVPTAAQENYPSNWRACLPKGNAGSNPALSASRCEDLVDSRPSLFVFLNFLDNAIGSPDNQRVPQPLFRQH